MAQPVVQVGHMLAPDRGNGQRAELGQNVLAHHTMVQLRRGCCHGNWLVSAAGGE